MRPSRLSRILTVMKVALAYLRSVVNDPNQTVAARIAAARALAPYEENKRPTKETPEAVKADPLFRPAAPPAK